MSTVRFTAEVLPDGTIQPPNGVHIPPGKVEITVESPVGSSEEPPQRRSLADWADREAEHWGERLQSSDVSSFTGRSD